jgi:predicted metal-dependent hydrolase
MTQRIPYLLKYSRRAKRLSLQVVPGEVRVTAPAGVRISVIDGFVRSRAKWIAKKLAYFASVDPPAIPAEFANGSNLSVFGETAVLQLSETVSEKEELTQRNGVLYVCLPGEADLTSVVKRWLDDRLLSHVNRIIEEHSRQGLIPSRIRLSNARTRWGSCSPRGAIMVNRMLVHAPLSVVEYVVVHELVHLQHRNHSKKFWGAVENILGDVKPYKQWLKLQGAYLLEEKLTDNL